MSNSEPIFLRPPDDRDIELLYDWENTQEFHEFSSIQVSYSREEIKEFISTIKEVNANKQFRLMICLRASDHPIGTVDLYEINFTNMSAGIGILLAEKSKRRKGYATTAIKLCVEFAKKKLSLEKLYCEIKPDNTASQDLFEKAGFGSKTLRKNAYYIDSMPVDVYFYEKNIQ